MKTSTRIKSESAMVGLCTDAFNRAIVTGFNPITFRDNNHISANIHKFGGAPSRPVGSHMATVDRARDQWLQIV